MTEPPQVIRYCVVHKHLDTGGTSPSGCNFITYVKDTGNLYRLTKETNPWEGRPLQAYENETVRFERVGEERTIRGSSTGGNADAPTIWEELDDDGGSGDDTDLTRAEMEEVVAAHILIGDSDIESVKATAKIIVESVLFHTQDSLQVRVGEEPWVCPHDPDCDGQQLHTFVGEEPE